MYEMATGKLPFDADSPVSVALKHIQEEPIAPKVVNSKVSGVINQIILKAMAKSTADRYKNATEMLDDLNVALKDPDKASLKPASSVEAGATQVIPIIAMKDLESKVPNVRTKQPRRMTFVTQNNKDEEQVLNTNTQGSFEENKNKDGLNNKKEQKEKKFTKIYIICAIALAVILVIVFSIIIANKFKGTAPSQVSIYVPNVVGRKFDEVVEEYSKQGISVLQDKLEYDATQPEGYIISQTPDKGSSTNDKKIYVVVSRGQKLVTVPDVAGKDYKVAKYELETTLGFVMNMQEEVSTTVAEGLVISQDPKKDEQKPYGSTINVKVSKGDCKAKVLMPKVLGKTEADAKKTLTDLKLTVSVENGEDASKANGIVISQSYPENQELKEGDLVKLTINHVSKSKTVTLNLVELQGGTAPTDPTKTIDVKVTASIDGGPVNTCFDKTLLATQETATLTLNGYTSANIQIYINNVKVKDQVINFT
jgi:serine/threonine-protein kinase